MTMLPRPKATFLAVKTAGMFREGQYYRSDQLGVLGRMAHKVGILVLADPPLSRLARKPSETAVKPRKRAARTQEKVDDGKASV